jgi:adenosine deaminase
VVEAVLAGLWQARQDFGIQSQVILCGIRNISPHSSVEMAELAVAYKNRGVVGFDLAGAENDHPAKHHLEAFQLVRDNNISVTIHAGEAYGPASIHQGAARLRGASHWARLPAARGRRPAALRQRPPHRPRVLSVQQRADRRRARPSRATRSSSTTTSALRVTVNTDNRLITDTTVSRELHLCHTRMGLDLQGIKHVVLNGFKASFLPFHEKQDLMRRVSRELERFPRGRQHRRAASSDGDRGARPPTSAREAVRLALPPGLRRVRRGPRRRLVAGSRGGCERGAGARLRARPMATRGRPSR